MIDIARIRTNFPILNVRAYGRPLVYLDSAATTQKPLEVLDAVLSFYSQSNSNIHRGTHYLSERASAQYERARETVRGFINAREAREVIFTHGATESINIVADSFARGWVKGGDEIVVSEMEHHSNLVPWQMLCARMGAHLKIISFDDQGVLRGEELDALLSDRTKLVAVCAVSNVLGTVNPIRDIVARAHEADVPVLIDAAQEVQHESIDVQALDCDFLVFSGHKMYAETGIGVLYGKERWLERMTPCRFGGGMIASVELVQSSFAEIPFKFEAGTPNIAGAISVQAAIEYLQDIGMDTIHAYEEQVLDYAAAQLSALDWVKLYGEGTKKHGVLSMNLDGISAVDAGMVLDKMGIAVRSGAHCAEPVMKHFGIRGTLRASFALYNTKEDVDALIEGLRRTRIMMG